MELTRDLEQLYRELHAAKMVFASGHNGPREFESGLDGSASLRIDAQRAKRYGVIFESDCTEFRAPDAGEVALNVQESLLKPAAKGLLFG